MNIDELVGLIDSGWIQPNNPYYQLVNKRIEQPKKIARLQNFKRLAEQPAEINDTNFKQLKSEFKYTNFEKLTFGAILQQFANWKPDITNLFTFNFSKFQTNSLKLITT